MIKKGGPANGTPLKEWTINDDGLGMLTGTLKVFLDGTGNTTGAKNKSGNDASITGSNKYSGNNGLSNPIQPAGGLGAGVPKTGDPHPYDARLKCFGVSVSRNSMNYGYAEAQYIGLLNDPAGVEWEITANTEDSPIETHPDFLITDGHYADDSGKPTGEDRGKFRTITKSGINPQTKGPYWNLKNVSIDGPTQSFKGFRASQEIIDIGLVGIESYKTPLATYRVSYTTAKTESYKWALSNLGCYFDFLPPFINTTLSTGTDVFGNKTDTTPASLLTETTSQTSPAQENSSDKDKKQKNKNVSNLLLTSVSVSQASGLYKVSVEFMRSGPRGWNSTIYNMAEMRGLDEIGKPATNK